MNNNLKYLALGILAGILTPYLITLIKKPQQPAQKQASEEEEVEETEEEN